jgi:hypothetical protein
MQHDVSLVSRQLFLPASEGLLTTKSQRHEEECGVPTVSVFLRALVSLWFILNDHLLWEEYVGWAVRPPKYMVLSARKLFFFL